MTEEAREVYIATESNQVVAYAIGDIKVLEEKTSYNDAGEKVFELDELYVDANYRDKGIGKALYKYIESDVFDKVDVIGVIATSYEYKRLLKFYVEELNMNFNHALLVKRAKYLPEMMDVEAIYIILQLTPALEIRE